MYFKIASVDSLIIYFGDQISKDVFKKVKNALKSIEKLNIIGLIDIIPSYNSIFITYDIFSYSYDELKAKLESSIVLETSEYFEEEIITIDVYYGTDVGLDLEYMSKSTSLSIEEIIQLHSNKLYDVYAIGFLPGYAYMATVDEKIALPRLETPRKKIPKGSVGIANEQTAIYPQDSPGGWNIIGKTALELFDKKLSSLSPLHVGAKIKFNPISQEEFIKQGGLL